jgi:site-specific DNA-methyltransferase (adenine-specific)
MSTLTPNRVLHGDCVQVMRDIPAESVDFVLTDPPYLARYRDRHGRTLRNDDNHRWLKPAFAEAFRLLKPDSLMVCFYGWHRVNLFFDAWQSAGFQSVGHIVLTKRYASSVRFLSCQHEVAYLLAKGNPRRRDNPLPDVLDYHYTGNRLHPTEKSPKSLMPLVQAFCKPGDTVLDPFCGSGSSLVAARDAGCAYLGIELDAGHHRTASERLGVGSPKRHVADEADCPMPWLQPFTRYAQAHPS